MGAHPFSGGRQVAAASPLVPPSEPNEAMRIYECLPELRLHRRTEKVVRIISRNASLAERYRALIEYVDDVEVKIKPFTPCMAGCDACCHMPAFIFQSEAKRMATASGKAMVKLPARDHGLVMAGGAAFVGVPCPFLQDHQCTIYAARPLVCRVHHSLAANADPCRQVNVTTLQQVPMLNPDYAEVPFHILMQTTRPHEPLGVIQEFFPE